MKNQTHDITRFGVTCTESSDSDNELAVAELQVPSIVMGEISKYYYF